MGISLRSGTPPRRQIKHEKYEAFLYVEQYDENTGTREWEIDITRPPLTLYRDTHNMCKFKPYNLVPLELGESPNCAAAVAV